MVKGVLDELAKPAPKNHFTVGINDDVTHTSLEVDPSFSTEAPDAVRALFYGLGADGTVGANKNSIKIIGEGTDNHAQGYFVYDSKKSGSTTISHLRFGPKEIKSTYLINKANFIACHQQVFLEKMDMLRDATEGATFLLNTKVPKEQVWDSLPEKVQRDLVEKKMKLYIIDAYKVGDATGMGVRINTIMQTSVSANAPDFVQEVTAKIIAGEGDLIPVSKMPIDGTYPTGTAQWEKRNIALEVPVWDEVVCIQCNKCVMVCPHATIRAKVYEEKYLAKAPDTFMSTKFRSKDYGEGMMYSLQVAVEDCTGCGLCVDVCPAKNKKETKLKAINMKEQLPLREQERANWDYFLTIPDLDRTKVNLTKVKDSQFLQPLFEFSGACSGCGDTPYVKLVSQLFGDRTVIANATGCSSIYGGNLPTTPWTVNPEGRGTARCTPRFEGK